MSSCYARHLGIDTIPLLLLVLYLLSVTLPSTSAQNSDDPNDPYNGYARFNPSMAVIIVVLIAALFFMGFFSIYIRHCSNTSGGSTTIRATTGGGVGRSRRGSRGLDASVIETFPTFVYSTVKGLKIGKGTLECAVCLNEFEDHETLRLLPKCDHVFHPDCIDAWLESHVTCPVCRANLVPQAGEPVPQVPGLGTEPESNSDQELGFQDAEEQQCGPDNERGSRGRTDLNNETLNRSGTRGSRSNRMRWFPFPRSHSTGHSLVQPGENKERFTLRLPAEVREQVVNRKLNRAVSLVVLPREGSSRKGYRTGGDGSSRGKSIRRFDRSDRSAKSDRWVFNMMPPFLSRALSFQSPRVAARDGEGTSMAQPGGSEAVTSNEPTRLPV